MKILAGTQKYLCLNIPGGVQPLLQYQAHSLPPRDIYYLDTANIGSEDGDCCHFVI